MYSAGKNMFYICIVDQVTFHDELVTIICETRQLVILGFTIDVSSLRTAFFCHASFTYPPVMLRHSMASFYALLFLFRCSLGDTLSRQACPLTKILIAWQPEIKKAVETAQNFQKQGMMLKQVASFYNEIATQMIPCQKIIMLQDALRLEAILKNPCDSLGKPIHWKNVQAVQVQLSIIKLQQSYS